MSPLPRRKESQHTRRRCNRPGQANPSLARWRLLNVKSRTIDLLVHEFDLLKRWEHLLSDEMVPGTTCLFLQCYSLPP